MTHQTSVMQIEQWTDVNVCSSRNGWNVNWQWFYIPRLKKV